MDYRELQRLAIKFEQVNIARSRLLAALPEVEAVPDERVVWLRSHILRHYYFNRLVFTRLTEQDVDLFIHEVKTYEHQPGLMFFWGVGPGSLPFDLGSRLTLAGAIYDGNYPYMICDLTIAKTKLPAIPGMVMHQVTTQSELEKWVSVLSISNEYPTETTQALIRLHTLQNLKPGAPCQLFLASLDGEPAATSILMMHGKMAGIFDVSTSPEFRGRGLGKAITLAAMQMGMQYGAKFSGLFSTPSGLGMYKSLGFEVGAAFDIFVWGE